MTKENQIKIPEDEMGMSGYSKFAWELWQQLKLPMDICEKVDSFVREQGYRKQSEGEWDKRTFIFLDSEKVGFRCSGCNTTWDTPTKFCPNCGAKMKGGAE